MGLVVAVVTAQFGDVAGTGALARVAAGVVLGAATYFAILGILGNTVETVETARAAPD
jgi:hypothetical protein